MKTAPIYLDYNATTPCDPRVVDVMVPYFNQHFGNAASRDHGYGWLAHEAVESAREQIASLIGASSPTRLVFTSGATESINLALKGLIEASPKKDKHIITSKTEHKAVLDTCKYLERRGVAVTYLDVDATGILSLEALKASIHENTVCVALMYANNETGVINPVQEIGKITNEYGVCFMCDATQAVGKVPVDVERDGIDLMAFSAHKLYGPKGIGALYMRNNSPNVSIALQQHGGNHERGSRSGTLNVPGIVGFGEAASLCQNELLTEAARLKKLRNALEQHLLKSIPGTSVNGMGNRLPHVSNVFFPHIDGEQLLLAISRRVALSRGSACSGIVQQPSHVLIAMGLKDDEAQHAIRVSLGRFTTEKEIEFAAAILTEKVSAMQGSHQMV